MSQGSSPAYRVVAADRILRLLDSWTGRAFRAGFGMAFLESLRAVVHKLENRPLEWGDPLYRLPAMNLLIHHAMSNFLNVHYGVDEERRIVYLKDVELRSQVRFGPDFPLAADE
jgi:hypothetical protein